MKATDRLASCTRMAAVLALAVLLHTSLGWAQPAPSVASPGAPPTSAPQSSAPDTTDGAAPQAELPSADTPAIAGIVTAEYGTEMNLEEGCGALFYGKSDYRNYNEFLADPMHSAFVYTNLWNTFVENGYTEYLSGEVSSVWMWPCEEWDLVVFDAGNLGGMGLTLNQSVANFKDIPHPSRNNWNDEIRSAWWVRKTTHQYPYVHNIEHGMEVALGDTYYNAAGWVYYFWSGQWRWTVLDWVEGGVDINTPGDYVVKYSVTDPSNHQSTTFDHHVRVRKIFQSYGGNSRDLSVGADGTFYTVDDRGYVQTGLFGGKTEVDGMIGAGRIDGAPNGIAWVVKDDGTIHTMHPNRTWTQAHNGFFTVDIAVGVNGTVKILNDTGQIYTFPTWAEDHKGFAASRIAVDGQGFVWAVDKFLGTVYVGGSGSAFQSVDGVLARDIAVGGPSGDVWVIAQDGLSLHKYSGGAWQPGFFLGGVEAASITVDASGNPWFVGVDGTLYSW